MFGCAEGVKSVLEAEYFVMENSPLLRMIGETKILKVVY